MTSGFRKTEQKINRVAQQACSILTKKVNKRPGGCHLRSALRQQINITTAEPTHCLECLPTRCEYSPRIKIVHAIKINLFKILKAAQNSNKNRVHLTHKNTDFKGKFEKESLSFSIMC